MPGPSAPGDTHDPADPLARDDDALPALPPLDDDGELVGDAVPDELVHQDRLDLDDATADDGDYGQASILADFGEREPDGLGLDDAPADVDVDAESELLVGDERGLLEGSDEGDGRDVSADEAGLFDDGGSSEDGGAEGTGEDPALGIDPFDEVARVSALREDDEDDDLPFDASVLAGEGARAWPPMADLSWTVSAVPPSEPRVWVETPDRAGDIVVDRARGELRISIDGGRTHRVVEGCGGATAVAALAGASRDRVAVVALFDASRDVSALAVVRAPETGPASAEIVAEIALASRSPVDDDDEHARVDALTVERVGVEIVVVASGPFGRVRVRGR
jgi:hypothetical protein